MAKIVSETMVWKPTIAGQVRSFDIPIVGHYNERTHEDELPVLALCGMGERLGTAKRVVRYLGKKGVGNALSLRMPFEVLSPSEANLTRISEELPYEAAQFLIEGNRADQIDIIARSQTAACTVMSIAKHPRFVRRAALIQSYGLTNSMLGETPEERMENFGQRVAQNITLGLRDNKSPLSLWELLLTARTQEARRNIQTSLLTAMAIDLSGTFQEQLTSGQQYRVFGSKGDPVFPYDELEIVAGTEHMTEVPGAHAASVSTNGFLQLDAAIDWLGTPES